jgi:hypothetical protein
MATALALMEALRLAAGPALAQGLRAVLDETEAQLRRRLAQLLPSLNEPLTRQLREQLKLLPAEGDDLPDFDVAEASARKAQGRGLPRSAYSNPTALALIAGHGPAADEQGSGKEAPGPDLLAAAREEASPPANQVSTARVRSQLLIPGWLSVTWPPGGQLSKRFGQASQHFARCRHCPPSSSWMTHVGAPAAPRADRAARRRPRRCLNPAAAGSACHRTPWLRWWAPCEQPSWRPPDGGAGANTRLTATANYARMPPPASP